VCLIQFSTPKHDYLLDPLALDDLSPLADVFNNPEIEKVFHAAEYDVICLKRDFQFEFNNLFDTMIAARILGHNTLGLGAILKKNFGIQVNKRYQRANWGQRPLPEHLLTYAQLDTHYLISIRQDLYAELREKGRWQLAQEDFERIQNVNGRNTEDTNNDVWRINGVYDLTPQQVAVLQELCNYRDKVARKINRPLFKVIGDKTLLAIAETIPRDQDELSHLPGMSDSQMRRHADELLAAVQQGLESPPIHAPRTRRPNESYLMRVEALKQWRKSRARKMGVNSDVVLPRDLLYEVAVRGPEQRDELGEILREVPWRLEHFGEEIYNLLMGV